MTSSFPKQSHALEVLQPQVSAVTRIIAGSPSVSAVPLKTYISGPPSVDALHFITQARQIVIPPAFAGTLAHMLSTEVDLLD